MAIAIRLTPKASAELLTVLAGVKEALEIVLREMEIRDVKVDPDGTGN